MKYVVKAVRNVTRKEYGQLSRLHKRHGIMWGVFRNAFHEQIPRSFVVLALDDQDKIRGWFLHHPDELYATCQVYVQQAYQKRGIGWQLIKRAKARLKKSQSTITYVPNGWGRTTTIFTQIRDVAFN